MRLGWRGALGILLSAVLLYVAFRGVHWDEVTMELRRANPLLLVLSAIAATGIFPLRARRWRTILDPVQPNLPFGMLWRSTAIGMMVNNVVPARAGEVARAYALARETRSVPFSTAFASLAVDRIFDAIVVLLLMFAAMLDPRFPENARILGRSVSSFALPGLLVVAGMLVALYLVVFFPRHIITMYEVFSRRIAPRFEERGRAVLVAFANGLSVLKSPGRFVSVFWWTLLHWLLNAFAFWLAFLAVGVDAPFSAALFVQGIIVAGVALPSSPGFFGIFELAGKVGLVVYGVGESLAVTWAVGFHILSYIPITVIGIVYFARLGFHMRELQTAGGRTVEDAA
jgi:glycosyltransferase 2 family protein